MKRITCLLLVPILCWGMYSCQKKEKNEESSYIRKYWNETASSNYEVPVTRSTEIKAKFFLNLMTDHVFYYDILVDTSFKEDELTAAVLYTGTAASTGTLFADLKPTINGRHLSGNVQLTAEQAAVMMDQPVFLNVLSKLNPGGLVRLQLEKNIDFYADIPLTGTDVVPAVTTAASGKVILRITTDKVLHYQVMVNGLETGDVLQETHLHTGASGTNGTQQYVMAATAADYNVVKAAEGVTDAILAIFKTGTAYIDVHSANNTAGLLRGQLR